MILTIKINILSASTIEDVLGNLKVLYHTLGYCSVFY